MKSGLLALVLLALAGCQPVEHDLAIVVARVFDGEKMLPATTVLVRDGIVVNVGTGRVSSNAELVECGDCTLLPGLIDSHVHISSVDDLRSTLIFGVTTAIDQFTFVDPEIGMQIQNEQRGGKRTDIADFRMAVTPVTSAEGLGTRFKSDIPTLNDETEAQSFVDDLIGRGANHIKIMFDDGRSFGTSAPNLSKEMLAASVQAAHARSKLAVVHVTSNFGASAATVAGADGLAHIFFDEVLDKELAMEMSRRGVFQIATLTTLEGFFREPGSGTELAENKQIAPYLTAEQIENLRAVSPAKAAAIGSFDVALENVRQLSQAGVHVLVGTDVPNPGTAHGVSVHKELALLVEAGLSPLDALRAATSLPAEYFGMQDRGRIEVGRRADFLMVRGDPSADITNTRDIVAVYKLGVAVDRESYRDAIVSGAND